MQRRARRQGKRQLQGIVDGAVADRMVFEGEHPLAIGLQQGLALRSRWRLPQGAEGSFGVRRQAMHEDQQRRRAARRDEGAQGKVAVQRSVIQPGRSNALFELITDTGAQPGGQLAQPAGVGRLLTFQACWRKLGLRAEPESGNPVDDTLQLPTVTFEP